MQTGRFSLTGGSPEPPTWASVSLCSQWDHSHLCTPKLTDLQLRPHFSTSLHSTTPESDPYSLPLLSQLLPALNSLHSGRPPLSHATLSSSQRWLPTPRPAACPHLSLVALAQPIPAPKSTLSTWPLKNCSLHLPHWALGSCPSHLPRSELFSTCAHSV